MLTLSFYDGGDTVPVTDPLPFEGIFIPYSSLPGMEVTDFENDLTYSCKESKVVYAIAQKIDKFLTLDSDKLGLFSTLSNPTVINSSTISYKFSYSIDYLVDNSAGETKMIPCATEGVYANVGKIGFSEVFPNSVIISDRNTQSSLLDGKIGVFIKISDLVPYGFFNDIKGSSLSTYNISGDCRYSIAALVSALCDGNITARTQTAASAILSTSISSPQIINIPTTYYSNTNPITSIRSLDLDKLSIIRRVYSITFELNLLPEYLEVNVTTI